METKKQQHQQQQKAPAAKSAAFEKAVEDSRKLKTPTQDGLLEVSCDQLGPSDDEVIPITTISTSCYFVLLSTR